MKLDLPNGFLKEELDLGDLESSLRGLSEREGLEDDLFESDLNEDVDLLGLKSSLRGLSERGALSDLMPYSDREEAGLFDSDLPSLENLWNAEPVELLDLLASSLRGLSEREGLEDEL